MQQAVVNSECEGHIFSISKSCNLDFSLTERRNQWYINSDLNADNSCFSEVLPTHYPVIDTSLLSQSKFSRKWPTSELAGMLYLLLFLRLRLYQHHRSTRSSFPPAFTQLFQQFVQPSMLPMLHDCQYLRLLSCWRFCLLYCSHSSTVHPSTLVRVLRISHPFCAF